ncbi:MAG: transcriptional regulator [Thermoprotei archaeon]|jgi:predicted Zn-ribbon and HTH transcriptional regulator|nr:transcriptional regulator [Thermoprotei archaeon]
MGEDFLTTREKIYKLLVEAEEPLSAEDMVALLGLGKKEYSRIQEDLEFVIRSVKKRSGGAEIVEMIPARCLTCGYVFKDRQKAKRPSKCPRCNSERIAGPWFILKKSSRK